MAIAGLTVPMTIEVTLICNFGARSNVGDSHGNEKDQRQLADLYIETLHPAL